MSGRTRGGRTEPEELANLAGGRKGQARRATPCRTWMASTRADIDPGPLLPKLEQTVNTLEAFTQRETA